MQSNEASSSGNNASAVSISSVVKPMLPYSQRPKYTFICECFFMTARVLNLGLMKGFSDFKHIVQVNDRVSYYLSEHWSVYESPSRAFSFF